MITPAQRQLARRIADEREHRHEAAGHNRKWTPRNGADSHYHGLLGEFTFANTFHTAEPDLAFIASGDNGMDLLYGGYRIDVKVSTFYGPKQYLRVPVDRMHEQTIYVAGLYDPHADDVALLRWEWGHELVRENIIQRFGDHPTDNYVKPVCRCRRMTELRELPCPIETW